MTALPASVTREVVLPASPEEVWPALTEADRLEEWFAPDVEIDARPGGGAVFRWEDAERHAVIEEVEAPHRLSFRWADGDEHSRVELTLDEIAEGTRLRVVETALAETLPDAIGVIGRGGDWPVILAQLAPLAVAA
jgi:uncharacterized protein YndB with AHSA1/START domain